MILNLSFLENNLELSTEHVCSIEIENKKYFYRIVDILNKYSKGIVEEEIFNSNINTKVLIDYFNLEQNNKKVITSINKLLKNNITELESEKLAKYYKKLLQQYEEVIKNIDIPLEVEKEFNLDNISKLFNLSIIYQNNILSNLLTIIDINKETNEYDLLIFINLKQYLEKEELTEFYKYAVYNKATIILIDFNTTGMSIKNEKKLIIDENLEEFMI